MKPLKINYIGNEAYVWEISRFFQKAGHDCLFYTDCVVIPNLSIGWFCETISDTEVSKIRRAELMTASPLSASPTTQDILKKLSDCDVIHGGGLYSFWNILAKKPYIYQMFGGDLSRWPFLDDTIEDRIRAYFIRQIIHNATFIWGGYHQKDTHQALTALGVSSQKIKPFCQPINTDHFRPAGHDYWIHIRRQYGSENKFIILLGSQLKINPSRQLNYSKGSHLFARAVKEFLKQSDEDSAVFWIVDKGPDRLEFRELIENIGLKNNVRWIPPHNKAKLPYLLNAADVVLDQLYPPCGSHGTFTLEAMACGKPVFLYLDKDFRNNIAREPDLPNVQVANVKDIRDRLIELYHDPVKREYYGRLGRECIIRHYAVPQVIKKLESIYREAIRVYYAGSKKQRF